MHIDFAPPSNGTYNNSGSCRQLANYMEHEDLERMEKGIYTEGFFNLAENNIYKSKVIKDIDTNIGQLLKRMLNFMLSMSAHRKRNSERWVIQNRNKQKQ